MRWVACPPSSVNEIYGILDECLSYIKEIQIPSALFVIRRYIEDLLKSKKTREGFFAVRLVTGCLVGKKNRALFATSQFFRAHIKRPVVEVALIKIDSAYNIK